jgi:hypothetical protein
MVSLEVFIDLMFPAAWSWGRLIIYTEMSTRNISWIKIRRLGWVGNIKMEYERSPKKVLNGKFHNTRVAGKPRTRWEEVVRMNTSQILGLR